MQQTIVTLTPKAGRDSVTGFQAPPALPPLHIERETQVTITVDTEDDDIAGYFAFLIPIVVGGAALLAGCETKTTVINSGSGTVNVQGGSPTVSPTTSVGVGGGGPRPQ